MQNVDFDSVEFCEAGADAADVLGEGVVDYVGGAVSIMDEEREVRGFACTTGASVPVTKRNLEVS